MKKTEKADVSAVRHIAFIMDGNGRWAKKRLMPREYGHSVGAAKFRDIVRHCFNRGIENITVYAFSTENWKRPKKEIDAIMKLFRDFIEEAGRDDEKNRIRIRFIGNRDFDEDMRKEMEALEALTASHGKNLCIAINYGGRGEIVDAVNLLIASGKTSIIEEDITNTIYSGIVPPPNMIVRTGGEMRLSNFLLWQSSYAELFFTDTLWPDLSFDEVDAMIARFSDRDRRFGGV